MLGIIRQTDRQTDRQTIAINALCPHPTLWGGDIINSIASYMVVTSVDYFVWDSE